MWPFSQWTTAGRAALTYLTIGALTVVWCGVWFVYLFNHPPVETGYYWCTGFLVTGLIMFLIGLGVGAISRSARQAEAAPLAEIPMVVNLQPNTGTSPGPVLARVNLTSPGVASEGQVILGQPESLSTPQREGV